MGISEMIGKLHRSIGKHRHHRNRCHHPHPKHVAEVAVVELRQGMHSHVLRVQTSDHARLHKLTAMGLLPGMPVELIQRFPTYLIKVGQTQLAIDHDMARAILVRPGIYQPQE